MDEFETFDPALFGLWAERPAYGDGIVMDDEILADRARGVLLEIKSAESAIQPAEELRRLLNDMTAEMRAQFETFRDMRRSAEKALEDGDEAAQKLARADVKAATDAMSLIVRTFEKVDSLQRRSPATGSLKPSAWLMRAGMRRRCVRSKGLSKNGPANVLNNGTSKLALTQVSPAVREGINRSLPTPGEAEGIGELTRHGEDMAGIHSAWAAARAVAMKPGEEIISSYRHAGAPSESAPVEADDDQPSELSLPPVGRKPKQSEEKRGQSISLPEPK
ncbi:hypothetical protein J2046_002050 [Rhizobium petrolearium]|uniref:hypothetical protein n=1 Tax=Neorhizobium petrolearium TaxID=515361 RepID=UPI001AE72095|nr:hypothetical protein [Neorhizobium petrolearium]MBP1843794.1 hypothetical protein [Neorhizobium petrolearium]